jgi:hypothetical protein
MFKSFEIYAFCVFVTAIRPHVYVFHARSETSEKFLYHFCHEQITKHAEEYYAIGKAFEGKRTTNKATCTYSHRHRGFKLSSRMNQGKRWLTSRRNHSIKCCLSQSASPPPPSSAHHMCTAQNSRSKKINFKSHALNENAIFLLAVSHRLHMRKIVVYRP